MFVPADLEQCWAKYLHAAQVPLCVGAQRKTVLYRNFGRPGPPFFSRDATPHTRLQPCRWLGLTHCSTSVSFSITSIRHRAFNWIAWVGPACDATLGKGEGHGLGCQPEGEARSWPAARLHVHCSAPLGRCQVR